MIHTLIRTPICVLKRKHVKRENLTTLTAEVKRYDHPSGKKNETMNDNTIRL